jgi:hypothetical protein
MEFQPGAERNYGSGALVPARNVKQVVMGAGQGRPPFNWEMMDDWAGVMPPEHAVPDFLADFVPAAELEPPAGEPTE